MHRRSLGRASALATVALLAVSGLASADSITADGDAASGVQNQIHIGTVAPGAEVTVPVSFELRCSTSNHVDAGQTVTLEQLLPVMAPPGGAVLSVTPGSVGPVPASWPDDGATCGDTPPPNVTDGTPATVTLRAPTALNVNYTYTIGFRRVYDPAGNADATAVTVTPSIVIRLDVAANTPPVLTVPADQVVEGNVPGGWSATYPGVSATDAEDATDPTPVCTPAPASVLPLGPTTVSCSVEDSGGLDDTGAFTVTVQDTTAPAIATAADVQVTTADPAGVEVSFATPAAVDVVDASPDVACVPASGSVFPVGTTQVTCTATDDSRNGASTDFDVTVDLLAGHTASAMWGEPVGLADGGTFVANRGRTVPIKVTLAVDGVVRTTGDAALTVAPCGGGAGATVPLRYAGGRWTAAIDTGALAGPCHTVTATIDGLAAGWFQLDLRGAEAAKAKARHRVAHKADPTGRHKGHDATRQKGHDKSHAKAEPKGK